MRWLRLERGALLLVGLELAGVGAGVLVFLGVGGCGRRAEPAVSFADRPGCTVVIDTTLTWSEAAADSARALSLLFPVEHGGEHRLRILAVPSGRAAQKRLAHVRARILRPGGRHLIGLDVRLYPEKRGSFPARRLVWPEGDLTFQPDRPGWYRLEVVRRGLEARRVRVRIEAAQTAGAAVGAAVEPGVSREESTGVR